MPTAASGTIGMIASPAGRPGRSSEWNRIPPPSGMPSSNAKENGVDNIRFVAVRMPPNGCRQAAAEKLYASDILLMDPPRAGCSRAFLQALLETRPERIVYISCMVETQARDLQVLVQGGYRVRHIQPVDMFPHTNHVECIVSLTRK